MPPTRKRKHTALDAVEATPPEKRTRRTKPAPPKPVSNPKQDSRKSATKRKTRGKPVPLSDSEAEIEPTRDNDEPLKVVNISSSSEPESDSILASQTRKPRRKLAAAVASDSEEDGSNKYPKKRLRRVRPAPMSDAEVDEDMGSVSDQGGNPAVKQDSDNDSDDLELPPQPSSSRPTEKQRKNQALERYAQARKNRSSPAPVPATAVKEEEDDDEAESDLDMWEQLSPVPELDGEIGVGDNSAQLDDESFIVDEDDDADVVNDALGAMRYAHREIEEHFAVFVEYIVAINSDPDFLSTIEGNDKASYESAVTALKRHIDPLANAIVLSTWKAPFIATLNLRPILNDTFPCEGGDCHACWTRGKYSCDANGSYIISTRKGVYDPKTFRDISEKKKKIKYSKQTQFENNAEARNLPYPPKFPLTVGVRCYNRALAYHEARHYLYDVSTKVQEEMEKLCEENEELADDPNALFQEMQEQEIISKVSPRILFPAFRPTRR
ncbi:hypothetical protein C8J57DRAFT_1316334 [Mycena rebaudengoi]|nr:hypothetical protein C8J57DRAFT_1316334 [Mycena rebaudengoi]